MAQTFEQQLRASNKVILDIIQQGVDSGVVRLDSKVVKKAVADAVYAILVAGSGITITYSESAVTITLTSP